MFRHFDAEPNILSRLLQNGFSMGFFSYSFRTRNQKTQQSCHKANTAKNADCPPHNSEFSFLAIWDLREVMAGRRWILAWSSCAKQPRPYG